MRERGAVILSDAKDPSGSSTVADRGKLIEEMAQNWEGSLGKEL